LWLLNYTDGFLKPYGDSIVRVNRRTRAAEINSILQDQGIDL
jgi:hypothetical protein